MIQRMMSLLRLFSSGMQGSTTHLKSQFKCQLNSSAGAYGFAVDPSCCLCPENLTIPDMNCLHLEVQRVIHSRVGQKPVSIHDLQAADKHRASLAEPDPTEAEINPRAAPDSFGHFRTSARLTAVASRHFPRPARLSRRVPLCCGFPKCAKHCAILRCPLVTPQFLSLYVGRGVAPIAVGFGQNTMKITLFMLFLLVTASAFGQAIGGVSSEAHMTQIPDHPQHADQHALAAEHSLVGGGGFSYAQGERPLWEFGPVPQQQPPTPLGDVARAFRKEKPAVKKAEIVLEKQGS
jgi:hypothetical protein